MREKEGADVASLTGMQINTSSAGFQVILAPFGAILHSLFYCSGNHKRNNVWLVVAFQGLEQRLSPEERGEAGSKLETVVEEVGLTIARFRLGGADSNNCCRGKPSTTPAV